MDTLPSALATLAVLLGIPLAVVAWYFKDARDEARFAPVRRSAPEQRAQSAAASGSRNTRSIRYDQSPPRSFGATISTVGAASGWPASFTPQSDQRISATGGPLSGRFGGSSTPIPVLTTETLSLLRSLPQDEKSPRPALDTSAWRVATKKPRLMDFGSAHLPKIEPIDTGLLDQRITLTPEDLTFKYPTVKVRQATFPEIVISDVDQLPFGTSYVDTNYVDTTNRLGRNAKDEAVRREAHLLIGRQRVFNQHQREFEHTLVLLDVAERDSRHPQPFLITVSQPGGIALTEVAERLGWTNAKVLLHATIAADQDCLTIHDADPVLWTETLRITKDGRKELANRVSSPDGV